MAKKTKGRWAVETNTLFDGWVNVWTQSERLSTGEVKEWPWTFPSRAAALKELREYIAETEESTALGLMADAVTMDQHRIVKVK